jgi:hypothetical protein
MAQVRAVCHQVSTRWTSESVVIPDPAGMQARVRPADLGRALEAHFLSKLEYLNAIGIALSPGARHQQAPRDDPDRGEEPHARRRRARSTAW